jgi:SAM-dependent methyltransferase
MNNYEYCAEWARTEAAGRDVRILDYGCGAGQTVALLRAAGSDAYGCDVFFEGNDYSTQVPTEFFGTIIRRMQHGVIPFESGSFDLLINNFVMEHVSDFETALDEIHRVLKPGGVALNMFPDRNVWMENHCRIPFLHRFPKGSRPRVYYAAALSFLGVGARVPPEAALPWSERICRWLDDWTFYRTDAEIRHAYGSRFTRVTDIEEQWLRARFGARVQMAYMLPVAVQRYLVRRIGSLAFTCQK